MIGFPSGLDSYHEKVARVTLIKQSDWSKFTTLPKSNELTKFHKGDLSFSIIDLLTIQEKPAHIVLFTFLFELI